MTPLLDERQVAELTQIKTATLRYYRRKGLGPKFSKIGRLVRYQAADVHAWVEQHAVTSQLGTA